MSGENLLCFGESTADHGHGKAIGCAERGIGPFCGQHRDHFVKAPANRVCVGRLPVAVSGVDVGPVLQQDGHGTISPSPRSYVKQCFAIVAQIWIGALA